MLQLCHQLVPLGFTFTFVNTHHNHQRLLQSAFNLMRTCHPIRMIFVEGGCPPEHHAHSSTIKGAFGAAQNMREQVEQLLPSIMEDKPVDFILADILFSWASITANNFGLPWVCFWSASAATCACFLHYAELSQQGTTHISIAGKQDGEVPVIENIPGLPPTSLNDVPKVWDEAGKLSVEFLKSFNLAVHQASFLLINTFSELEGQADANYRPDKSKEELGEQELVSRPNLFREDKTCLEWLDKQASSSVLFISFGSISARTELQLEELARGVEASGCPLLWVRRPDNSLDFTLGQQLSDAHQHGNGLIVPWAPQLEVLSHPAIGCFVTHCGWNSVLESVTLGVPMLCWADMGKRMCNQRFVVQVWKCGLDMVPNTKARYKQLIDNAVLIVRDDIEKSIRCLMEEEKGASIRTRVAKLRDVAISTFRSFDLHFHHFVQAMQHSGLHSK
ncbi:hypothetical protein GOP47_0024805 [Adiantum capillus-veneris]|uniref:Glycosyltransferase n=1 Tax=Adiantum capillus-veneris TaxID=13818 RepID=A0A9D4Z3Z2_ADICA|nr:hypothetical protein GOP47_0024805 [Adiantum capillus-veneris]